MRARATVLCCIALFGCSPSEQPGQVLDEALKAGLPAAKIRAAHENYFAAMDGGIELTEDEVQGRNTWLVWSGGNDRMWDWIAMQSEGTLDLLKTLSSHPKLKFSRDNRWDHFGLVNEPCFEKATGPDAFGLWLDKRSKSRDCPERD